MLRRQGFAFFWLIWANGPPRANVKRRAQNDREDRRQLPASLRAVSLPFLARIGLRSHFHASCGPVGSRQIVGQNRGAHVPREPGFAPYNSAAAPNDETAGASIRQTEVRSATPLHGSSALAG